MKRFDAWRSQTGLALIAALFLFSGCSNDAPFRVLANGEPIEAVDYAGKAFPFFYILVEEGVDGSRIVGGEAEVSFIDEDSLEVKLPGDAVEEYRRVGATNEFELVGGGAGDPALVVENTGPYKFVYVPAGTVEGFDFAGFLGFETPVDLRTAEMAIYEGEYMGVAFGTAAASGYAGPGQRVGP